MALPFSSVQQQYVPYFVLVDDFESLSWDCGISVSLRC